MSKEIYDEINRRIIAHSEKDNGNTKEINLMWRGYISSIFEWGEVNLQEYDILNELLDNYYKLDENISYEYSRISVDLEDESFKDED